MRGLEWWRWRHTLLLVAAVLFLVSYFGLISWGGIQTALERLAAEGTIKAFQSPMGRGEAIITSFIFLMLSPLAVLAVFGVVTFAGAVLAGLLRSVVPVKQLPDGVFSTVAYGAIVGAAWLWWGVWFPWVREAAALVARAILIAMS